MLSSAIAALAIIWPNVEANEADVCSRQWRRSEAVGSGVVEGDDIRTRGTVIQ